MQPVGCITAPIEVIPNPSMPWPIAPNSFPQLLDIVHPSPLEDTIRRCRYGMPRRGNITTPIVGIPHRCRLWPGRPIARALLQARGMRWYGCGKLGEADQSPRCGYQHFQELARYCY